MKDLQNPNGSTMLIDFKHILYNINPKKVVILGLDRP